MRGVRLTYCLLLSHSFVLTFYRHFHNLLNVRISGSMAAVAEDLRSAAKRARFSIESLIAHDDAGKRFPISTLQTFLRRVNVMSQCARTTPAAASASGKQ